MQKAVKRYQDIGNWLNRDESLIRNYNPHVFAQGSFMLGTAIRPINEQDEYDLDLVCKLADGYSNINHTQKNLKNITGKELELYRIARGIQLNLESKHRCWRLLYKDELAFHIDIVPSISANFNVKNKIFEEMRKYNEEKVISMDASRSTLII